MVQLCWPTKAGIRRWGAVTQSTVWVPQITQKSYCGPVWNGLVVAYYDLVASELDDIITGQKFIIPLTTWNKLKAKLWYNIGLIFSNKGDQSLRYLGYFSDIYYRWRTYLSNLTALIIIFQKLTDQWGRWLKLVM